MNTKKFTKPKVEQILISVGEKISLNGLRECDMNKLDQIKVGFTWHK